MDLLKLSKFYSTFIYISRYSNRDFSFPSFQFRLTLYIEYVSQNSLAPFSLIYIYMYVSFLFGCKSAGNFTIRMERRFAASLSSASTLRPPCIYTIVALYAWKLLTYADIYMYEEEGVGRGWLATRQME